MNLLLSKETAAQRPHSKQHPATKRISDCHLIEMILPPNDFVIPQQTTSSRRRVPLAILAPWRENLPGRRRATVVEYGL